MVIRLIIAFALLLTGCRHTRPLDADERAVVGGTRDQQAAADMLAILTAGRAMNFTNEQKSE